MSDAEPPAPRPVSALTDPPQTPAIADALRALGPDYEEALVNSIAARVDELARERERRSGSVPPLPGQHPQAPQPLVPQPPPTPIVPPPAAGPEDARHGPHHHHEGAGPLPLSILSVIFGFVITVVTLTAGLAIAGPLALIAVLIVWVALVLINVAAWGFSSPNRHRP